MPNNKTMYFQCGKHKLPIGKKTYVMGILNLTPDSFSDGGEYNNIDLAVKRAKAMIENGADIIDIGGESTRPGYKPVDEITEISRVVPVIENLSKEIHIPISIDTSKSEVAERALEAGASIVNDIWGLQKEPEMAKIIAKFGAGVIIMHNSETKEYKNLMLDIIKFFRKSINIAKKAGIYKDNMVIDPRIGFGKTLEQNIEVMRNLKKLNCLCLPTLLGTSRKSLIGNILDLPVNERLEGTSATITLGISRGIDIIRVHDVKEMNRVARMTDAIVRY